MNVHFERESLHSSHGIQQHHNVTLLIYHYDLTLLLSRNISFPLNGSLTRNLPEIFPRVKSTSSLLESLLSSKEILRILIRNEDLTLGEEDNSSDSLHRHVCEAALGLSRESLLELEGGNLERK